MQFIDLDNAREDEQKRVMQDIENADHCPFCLENLKKYHKKPIIKETEYWVLTENQWPYKFTQLHFLIIYKYHATKLSELEAAAGDELIELIKFLEKKYNIPGGGIVMRFGDTKYSAGTVNHIHAQVLVPDVDHPDYLQKPVRVKIGKTKK